MRLSEAQCGTFIEMSIHSSEEIARKASEFTSVREVLAKPLSDEQFQRVINKYYPGFLEETKA